MLRGNDENFISVIDVTDTSESGRISLLNYSMTITITMILPVSKILTKHKLRLVFSIIYHSAEQNSQECIV